MGTFFQRSRISAHQFQLQTLFPHVHGPTVIGAEDRLKQEREIFEQRLVRADFPVVGDIHPLVILPKRPDASPDKVSPGFQGKPIGILRLNNPERPA